jgi:hypothetical protein
MIYSEVATRVITYLASRLWQVHISSIKGR